MMSYCVIWPSWPRMSLLNLLVSLFSYSCISNKFQSERMHESKLLKKSSKSFFKLSRTKTTWFLKAILCFVKFLLILEWTSVSLYLISSRDFSISFYSEVLKSSLFTEFNGTTGCNKWLVSRHFVHIFSSHFRQNRMKSWLWIAHLFSS